MYFYNSKSAMAIRRKMYSMYVHKHDCSVYTKCSVTTAAAVFCGLSDAELFKYSLIHTFSFYRSTALREACLLWNSDLCGKHMHFLLQKFPCITLAYLWLNSASKYQYTALTKMVCWYTILICWPGPLRARRDETRHVSVTHRSQH